MFTGIIEELATLDSVPDGQLGPGGPGGPGGRIVVRAELAGELAPGDSVAVNGCCLTVVDQGSGWWAADAVAETLSRTTLGNLRPGERVNLERPVRLEDRLGGHLVQGHVDGVGTVLRAAPDLVVSLPASLSPYVVEKGSITLDGVSLTVVDAGRDQLRVAVIPHTARVTTLGRREPGDRVNIEVDVLAKYVERLLATVGAGG
jgi:riboflavin synthase